MHEGENKHAWQKVRRKEMTSCHTHTAPEKALQLIKQTHFTDTFRLQRRPACSEYSPHKPNNLLKIPIYIYGVEKHRALFYTARLSAEQESYLTKSLSNNSSDKSTYVTYITLYPFSI